MYLAHPHREIPLPRSDQVVLSRGRWPTSSNCCSRRWACRLIFCRAKVHGCTSGSSANNARAHSSETGLAVACRPASSKRGEAGGYISSSLRVQKCIEFEGDDNVHLACHWTTLISLADTKPLRGILDTECCRQQSPRDGLPNTTADQHLKRQIQSQMHNKEQHVPCT